MNTNTKNMIDSEKHSFRNADEHLRFRFIKPTWLYLIKYLLSSSFWGDLEFGNFSLEVVLAFVLAEQWLSCLRKLFPICFFQIDLPFRKNVRASNKLLKIVLS